MKRALLTALLALAAVAMPPAAARLAAAPEKADGGIRFTYTDPNAGAVAWAGEFNGWSTSATPMAKGASGVWSVVVPLPAGTHQYKFVVDGQWVADPENGVTAGDFGNSVVTVGPDGNLVTARATSNTAYSPKIFMGGRIIGLYQDIRSAEDRRFELRRPDMDINLDFDVRMSDVLKAHFLMDINSEKQNAQDYRTALVFDRGSLLFSKPRLQILGYDNEDVGSWDDPLRLVGNVGIYRHAYGYHRQGFKLNTQQWGFDTEAHYADNFDVGGTVYPDFTTQEFLDLSQVTRDSMRTVRSGGAWVLAPGQVPGVFRINASDANEDMFAFRTRRTLGHGLKAGLLGRSDRGFDLGAGLFNQVTGPLGFQRFFGLFEQQWYAVGGELSWEGPRGLRGYAEFLRGARRFTFVPNTNSFQSDFTVTGADSTGITGYDETSLGQTISIIGRSFDMDRSDRWLVGGSWTEAHGDIVVRTEMERQTHDYRIIQDGLSNAMTVSRLTWDRNWRHYLDREVRTSLGVEFTNFDYDPRTPWDYQMWFPNGNFWLEHNEHVVSVDRLVMLGGADAVQVRPMVEIPVLARRNGVVRWKGTFDAVALDRQPKYAESIFQLGCDVTRALRFGTDSRWVKYDDPFLGLFGGYHSHYADLNYTFAPGITVELGFGVDPWVIDPPVNEYAPIGRDLFLFDRGANAATARTNYYGLGPKIAAAEKALENERRLQLKAIVRF